MKTSWFRHNWQQKLFALMLGLFLWFGVNHSIIATKTIPNIPIRIINLPPDKTIAELLPNGIYNKRISLTLSGNKSVVEGLEPGDIEVLLDASQRPDEWVVQITKKNLVSLNPGIDLGQKVTSLSQPELVINLSRLITENVQVTILNPIGDPPKGYQFLDVWPRKLMQEVSGPEEEIANLAKEGLELVFNLDNINKDELDDLATRSTGMHDDEVTYMVPSWWKRVEVPYLSQSIKMLNDPQAEYLRIDFLKELLIPVEQNLPVSIFYPLDTSSKINPETTKLAYTKVIKTKDHVPYLNLPLYISGASRRFVDVVRSHLNVVINARPKRKSDILSWNVQAVNPKMLEDQYVSLMMSDHDDRQATDRIEKQREKIFRTRFREYLHNLRLYVGKQRKLKLDCCLKGDQIEISTDDV